jgi:SAM-dependent methyltransferase
MEVVETKCADRSALNISDIATNLEIADDRIWFSKGSSAVSYPSAGNAAAFEVEDRSFWFQHRNRCIASIVRCFPPAGAIFDLGGGNGFVSLGLQTAGWQSIVVEPGRVGAMNARRRGLENVICATLEDANFRSHSLPAVGLFDVLEHIQDDGQFLRTLGDRLIPGGRIYLTVPAHRWLWSAEDVSAGHFRRYTLTSLGSVLAQSGFDLEFASYIFSVLPVPILLKRTIPSLLGRRKTENFEEAIRELRGGSRTLERPAGAVFDWELRRLKRRKTIPAGASCLVVAKSGRC